MRKLTEAEKEISRARRSAKQRERIANMTPEQRKARRDYSAKKNKEYNLRPEQKARKAKIARAWERNNPRKMRNFSLKKNYGITIEEWEQLFDSQGRRCAICKSTSPGKSNGGWHTDHCHKTKKVRGVLCNACNIALGLFRDSEIIMCVAACYVMEHRGE